MVDLETLAVSPRAVVLTLGAVKFDPYASGYLDSLYMRINIDDQLILQRETDPKTLDWWAKQDSKIMEEAFSSENRVPLQDGSDDVYNWNATSQTWVFIENIPYYQ